MGFCPPNVLTQEASGTNPPQANDQETRNDSVGWHDAKPSEKAQRKQACGRLCTCLGLLSAPGRADHCAPSAIHQKLYRRPTPSAASSLALPDCIISPDDVLTINVYDAPDVTGEYRVSPTGQIEIPLLSAPIVAAGRTPAQLSELISERYRQAEIYSHPRVTVAIKESRVHAITIAGAVKKPQIYPVFGKTTLLDLLSQAEGLAEDAGSLAIVTRGDIAMQVIKSPEACGAASKPASCDSTFSVDLSRLTETGDPLLNVDLYPGDRVTVQRAGIVYVVGAVNRPGGFPLKTGQEKMTVIQALALGRGSEAHRRPKESHDHSEKPGGDGRTRRNCGEPDEGAGRPRA